MVYSVSVKANLRINLKNLILIHISVVLLITYCSAVFQ